MSDKSATGAPLDITVGKHHFHRTEHGMVTHHIAGRPDHSVDGLRSTLEAFAEEITRLRQLLPSEARNQDEAPPRVDPMGSRPDQ